MPDLASRDDHGRCGVLFDRSQDVLSSRHASTHEQEVGDAKVSADMNAVAPVLVDARDDGDQDHSKYFLKVPV